MNGKSQLTQKQIVTALLKPETYDERTTTVELLQTHISFIFLTDRYVYKVKKNVNFEFLDFTSLRKRHYYCKKELTLNRRLCGDMYLEVVSINKSTNIKVKGEGETIEYAVKMKRIPQNRMMTHLLEKNRVTVDLVDRIAKTIAGFHSKAESNVKVNKFGSDKMIETNWQENFRQTCEFIGKTISIATFNFIKQTIQNFIAHHVSYFKERVNDGRIRDCHGDIHSGNIFITDRILIFDAIEFNERFRYSDVASDIAFLAMDLDFKGHHDLASVFVKKYVKYSDDQKLIRLLSFYKCYRAYVRGKVASFKLKDPHIPHNEIVRAKEEARAYFKLALEYAQSL